MPKLLNDFNSFINEVSQSKKIKKYTDFSVVLKWYSENKEGIAKTLGVEASELASEAEIVEQTKGLVKYVINPQSTGNDGRNGIGGFEEFDKLEHLILHDIFHNLYDVQSKNFKRKLDRYEYDESEIIEEIEILAIEESYSKFFGVRYLKSDFINQNINQLASYLMMAILKDDPRRIEQILDGEVEPYLEHNDIQYPVKGTGFESFFNMLKYSEADEDNYNISSSKDFREYMLHLMYIDAKIAAADGGDRGQYPDGNYEASISYYDLNDDQSVDVFEQVFIDDKQSYLVLIEDEEYDMDELFIGGTKLNFVFGDDFSDDVNDGASVILPMSAKPNVDEPLCLTRDNFFRDYDYKDYIIQNYINEDVGIVKKYMIVIEAYGESLSIMTEYRIMDILNEYVWDDSYRYLSDMIDTSEYDKMNFSELAEVLFKKDSAAPIMRRNFRTNTIIRNNTKLNTDVNNEAMISPLSLSKAPLTNNAKDLKMIMDKLRGYLIKNFQSIKKGVKVDEDKLKLYKYLRLRLDSIMMMVVGSVDKGDTACIQIDFIKPYDKKDGFLMSINDIRDILAKLESIPSILDAIEKLAGENLFTYENDLLMKAFGDDLDSMKMINFTKFKENINKFVRVMSQYTPPINLIKSIINELSKNLHIAFESNEDVTLQELSDALIAQYPILNKLMLINVVRSNYTGFKFVFGVITNNNKSLLLDTNTRIMKDADKIKL
jgi:hypothetical protein